MAPGESAFSHFVHSESDPSSLSSDRVISFAAGEPEGLWVGTEAGGLNRLDLRTGRFEIYRALPGVAGSLSSDAVFSVHQDRRGTVWVGTENGLNRLDRQAGGSSRRAFRRYGRPEGLPNEQVYGILEDDDGFLWVTTNAGLARLDPTTDEFLTFDLGQGLLSAEFNSGAYFRSASGQLFVGGSAGFNAFFPELLDSQPIPPPVILTRFQKLNQDVELETALVDLESIVLTHRDYLVSFEFAALDFTAPDKNRYSYMLEGFDPDWVEPSNVRRATYTNFDPGEYVFRVRGANNFGVWNDDGLALTVTVVPPLWRTWWVYTIYAAAIVAVLALFARAQTRKVQLEAERSRELERQVAQRTRELAKRNEELDVARHRFEQASLTDPLTELRNRRYLAQNIAQSLAPVERFYSQPVAVDHADRPGLAFFICDLDAFKDVNDKYGHAAGNRVLIEVARRLESACRKSDIIVRWGATSFW